jgi:O-antigen/teichoic acid export membrane protein
LRTPLFKVSSLNALSIAIRLVTGAMMSKLMAIFIGPSGLALVGNLRNFMASAETLVILGFQNGIIKYSAKKKENQGEFGVFLYSLLIFLTVLSLAAGAVLFLFSDFASIYLFDTSYYSRIIKAMALALPFYAILAFMIAVINGLGKFRQVTYINMWISATSLIVSGILVWQVHLTGAMIAVVLGPIVSFFISLRYFLRSIPEKIKTHFDGRVIKKLSSYSLMTLVPAVIGPFVLIAVRNELIDSQGMDAAGYWEGMNRLSTYYMMFLGALLTSYYLPKLSLSNSPAETGRVMRNYFKGVMPVFIIGLIVIYLFRGLVVKLLFTEDFLPMRSLFAWQLAGDFLKGISLILAYNFFAEKKTWIYIGTELFSLCVLYFSAQTLIARYALDGVVMAHCFTYTIYLVVLLMLNGKYLRRAT